jgi:hypothetical protein
MVSEICHLYRRWQEAGVLSDGPLPFQDARLGDAESVVELERRTFEEADFGYRPARLKQSHTILSLQRHPKVDLVKR